MEINGYINTKEAAELKGFTAGYISRLIRKGELNGVRVGHDWLVKREDVLSYVPGPQGFAAHPYRPSKVIRIKVEEN